ncbi:MAG: DUF4336 domain-containing protein [Hyphomicrobiaceae bacterium]
MLEIVDDGIWLAEGECVDFYGFPYPTRSVIIRLENGALWVWSPIRLSTPLRAAVERLGRPEFLISPNKIHHLFLSEWAAAYPSATLWGPRSTIKKRVDLRFQSPLENEAPEEWKRELDQVWIAGSFLMDEIVFFHRASRTAILADLSENFSATFLTTHWQPWQRRIAKIWGIVEGRGYAPLEWRLTFFDRRATRQARDAVLSWKPQKVIMAHGEWQRHDGRAFLERSLSWI